MAEAGVNLEITIDPLAIGEAISNAININSERGAFTDNLVQTTFYQAGQKYNTLVVNMAQHPQPGGLNEVVFHGSVNYSDGTIFGIWAFKDGEFTHDGDGGWINWAMDGWFVRDCDGGKHVVFYDPTSAQATGNAILTRQVLNPGNFVNSSDGRYKFIYQTDGNLVLYQGSQALWSSGTAGHGSGVCIMQSDGNLVIYVDNDNPIWASATSSHPGSHFELQNDGNGVIYTPDGQAVWATNTVQ